MSSSFLSTLQRSLRYHLLRYGLLPVFLLFRIAEMIYSLYFPPQPLYYEGLGRLKSDERTYYGYDYAGRHNKRTSLTYGMLSQLDTGTPHKNKDGSLIGREYCAGITVAGKPCRRWYNVLVGRASRRYYCSQHKE